MKISDAALEYLFDFIGELSFKRVGGTEEELAAALMVAAEVENAAGEAELAEFTIPASSTLEASLYAQYAGGWQAVPMVPYSLCGSLGTEELELFYACRGAEEDYCGRSDLSGCAVMLNELTFEAYKLLCKKRASAFIVIAGRYYEDFKQANVYSRPLKDSFLALGRIPGCFITAADATELVRSGVRRVRMTLRQELGEAVSRNVLSVIEGTELPRESVVLTAHYDSVPVGYGSWDNATGTAALLYLYRLFKAEPPRRTLRFIWCGSEELGLLGSRAYVSQNEELLSDVQCCFNFDMCGTLLGPNRIFATGGSGLKTFAEQFCREYGYSAAIEERVHSSDSAPFCDRGIPALGLSRGTSTAQIHTRYDTMYPLGEEALRRNLDFAGAMVSRVVNSARLPFDREISEEMRRALAKYFNREEN